MKSTDTTATRRPNTGATLKQMQRQQHREAAQRLESAKLRGDRRAIVTESIKFHATKP